MRLKNAVFGVILAISTVSQSAETVYTPLPAGKNPAAEALPRDDWYAAVQAKFTKYGNKPAEIVFDGDSITNRWEAAGKAVWTAHFASRAADFGIEGDRTENVLWRLSKGQLDGVNPKFIVLMIGTNNIAAHNTPDQIIAGIKAVVAEYQKRAPSATIILMAVFPRGHTADDPARQQVKLINAGIAGLGNGKQIRFVDIGDKLVEPDGTIAETMMPGYLHPLEPGYRIWADAILPIIDGH